MLTKKTKNIQVSRFRMMQASKLQAGKVARISDYEPCDLFSDNESDVQRALGSLLDEPQNNLMLRAWRAGGAPASDAPHTGGGGAKAKDAASSKEGEGCHALGGGCWRGGGALAAEGPHTLNPHTLNILTLSVEKRAEREHILAEALLGAASSPSRGGGAGGGGEAERGGEGERAFCDVVAQVLADSGVLRCADVC